MFFLAVSDFISLNCSVLTSFAAMTFATSLFCQISISPAFLRIRMISFHLIVEAYPSLEIETPLSEKS